MEISVAITVHGVAQGVGFRPFIYRNAIALGLSGYVKNRGDAVVEITVKGNKHSIQEMVKRIEEEHPPPASIEKVEVKPTEARIPSGFQILKSDKTVAASGSTIPADISVCNKCLAELRTQGDRRHRYFFITCTECGPRFTIIEDLPYDRENTSMKDFKLCRECQLEYADPSNRRFHAQTIACNEYGPTVKLTENDGKVMETKSPIEDAGKLVEEGYIVAIKGNGGYHIASSAIKSEPIERLRMAKHRTQKPFAVMARDIVAAKGFANISESEEETLSSPVKPILLAKLKKDAVISG
ncbi:MAG: acylphosphatase, partial [Candidatus Hodarchaeota archaeon]